MCVSKWVCVKCYFKTFDFRTSSDKNDAVSIGAKNGDKFQIVLTCMLFFTKYVYPYMKVTGCLKYILSVCAKGSR